MLPYFSIVNANWYLTQRALKRICFILEFCDTLRFVYYKHGDFLKLPHHPKDLSEMQRPWEKVIFFSVIFAHPW